MYKFVLLFLGLFAGNLVGADDTHRCPAFIPRNQYLKTHAGRCYQFSLTEIHWFAARDYCARKGGSLITIEHKHIQIFVERSLTSLGWGRNGLWIGATDDHKEHDWRWVTGDKVSNGFSNWDRGQPSCFLPKFLCKEDCACLRLDEGFKWHDYFCRANGFEYSFICQYDMLPETTTTTTTKKTTTTTTTTAPTTPKVVPTSPDPISPVIVVKEKTAGDLHSSNLMHTNSTKREPSSTTTAIDHHISVESQRLSSEKKGMAPGSIGLVVSFVLIFIAGIVVGFFLCRRIVADTLIYGTPKANRVDPDETAPTGAVSSGSTLFANTSNHVTMRRYRKRYDEPSMGFNNVLYEEAPRRTKDTNLMVMGAMVVHNSDTEEDDNAVADHRYCDIDDIAEASCQVKLPNKDSGLPRADDPPPKYCEVVDNERMSPDQEMGGACGNSPPPPCEGGAVFQQFTPDFLSKDTDVLQAYSNNLYGFGGK